jgi:hypothetical protein
LNLSSRIGRLAGVASALIIGLAAAVGPISPASAAPCSGTVCANIGEGLDKCPSQYLCLWDDYNYKGYGVAIKNDQANYRTGQDGVKRIQDKASSAYNHGTGTAWDKAALHNDSDCTGSPFVVLLQGAKVSDMRWVAVSEGQPRRPSDNKVPINNVVSSNCWLF